jgi:hypothetical protein
MLTLNFHRSVGTYFPRKNRVFSWHFHNRENEKNIVLLRTAMFVCEIYPNVYTSSIQENVNACQAALLPKKKLISSFSYFSSLFVNQI